MTRIKNVALNNAMIHYQVSDIANWHHSRNLIDGAMIAEQWLWQM